MESISSILVVRECSSRNYTNYWQGCHSRRVWNLYTTKVKKGYNRLRYNITKITFSDKTNNTNIGSKRYQTKQDVFGPNDLICLQKAQNSLNFLFCLLSGVIYYLWLWQGSANRPWLNKIVGFGLIYRQYGKPAYVIA